MTILEIHALAKKRGGLCHSKRYVNGKQKIKWQCKEGHLWSARVDHIKRGHWCLECKDKDRREKTLVKLQMVAKKRGGRCLSHQYVNSNEKLQFECKDGHRWLGTPYHISSGVWCPVCGGSNPLSLETMKRIAEERDGQCLSKKYINTSSYLKWRCKSGHEWEATGGSVRGGSWCLRCALQKRDKKYPLKHWRSIAEKRGGQCLSIGIFGVKDKIMWRCANGHEWKATGDSVQRGTWCNKCADKVRAEKKRHDLTYVRRELKLIQIELLSETYESSIKPLEVRCAICKHNWFSKWGNLNSGFGCPRCAKKVVYWEDIERNVKSRFGTLVSRKFKSAKSCMRVICANDHRFETTWDKLKRGSWCPYCPASIGERICRLYFEHLFRKPFPKVRPVWLKSEKLRGRLELDGFNEKLKLAFEHHGVQHYKYGSVFVRDKKSYDERVHLDNLKRRLCKKNGVTLIEIPEVPSMLSLENLLKFILNELEKEKIVPVRKGIRTLNLRPAFLHSSRQQLVLLQELAKVRGGKCLSFNYLNNHTKMTWECKKGHVWNAVPSSIKIGTWCPQCAGRKKR